MIYAFTWAFKAVFLWSVWVFFRPIYAFKDKKAQSRKINGGAIVVANHVSGLDFMLLLLTFSGRTLRAVIGETAYDINPILRVIFNLFGMIKADRFGRKLDFTRKAIAVAKGDGVVEIFPEGRFPMKGERELLPFSPSVIYIAAKSGKPIIPVYQERRTSVFERTKVVIGEPVFADKLISSANPTAEELVEAADALRERVSELKKEL